MSVKEDDKGGLDPTGIRRPRASGITDASLAEFVTVLICSEEAMSKDGPVGMAKEVFAVYAGYDESSPSDALKEWRAEGKSHNVDRSFIPRDGVIVNEPDIMEGLAAPRVVLLGRDVTRLVMSAATFQERTRLRESGLAKLSPEERMALGLGV